MENTYTQRSCPEVALPACCVKKNQGESYVCKMKREPSLCVKMGQNDGERVGESKNPYPREVVESTSGVYMWENLPPTTTQQ